MRSEVIDYRENTTFGFTYLTSPNIQTKHAFTIRYGEASDGKFSKECFDGLKNALDLSDESIAYSKQVHGTSVRVITNEGLDCLLESTSIEADGLITKVPCIALMVFTADCVPILLHDPIADAVGAVHAGWCGTVSKITAAAVDKMKNDLGCSPANIRAAIGPCISKCCYETDDDVANALNNALGDLANTCVVRHGKKCKIDLKEANRLTLQEAGLRDISISDDCTMCMGDRYWSHRKHGKNRGSQAAVILC